MISVVFRSGQPQFKLFVLSSLKKYCSYSKAPEFQSVKKLKLLKRLASTLLFGSTFLAVLYSRKHKHSKVFEEAKLVVNTNYAETFKLYDYHGYVLPSLVMKNLDKLKSFVCREDDIFVVSFPKTGTTWLQELVYSILNGVEEVSSKSIEDRFPYLEFWYPGLSAIEKMSDQRFLKSHLPFSLLPDDVSRKKPKILCIVRNPKDVLVSYYHFVRMLTVSDYKGSFEDFFTDFISDLVPYGPVWKHYNEIWEHRNDENVLVLSYEDLHKDIEGNILKIAQFLGKSLTPENVEKIADHCSFYNMSRNPNVNYQHWDDIGIRNKNESNFMRKGVVGDSKNYLSPDMNQTIDLWISENFKDISVGK